MDISSASLDDPDARALIAALNAELSARYPEVGAAHFRLDAGEVADGRGAFLIARAGDEAIGCGAIRLIDRSTAEIKRMYTRPERRGSGTARAILEALERTAISLGALRVVLETGVRQPDAIRLYERSGFVRIDPFGEYIGSELSVCMAKLLQGSAQQRK